MTPTLRIATLSTILALGLAVGAQAQPPAPDGHRGPHAMGGEMQAQMKAMHEAHQRQRAADLRTILRLRPDQEGALTAFLQSRHPPMEIGPRHGPEGGGGMPPGAGHGAAMTTPQRLDEMARREAEHAVRHQQHAEALRNFYAALGPDQRQVFDALQRMHGPGESGGEPGWGRPGFGGGFGRGLGGPPPPRED